MKKIVVGMSGGVDSSVSLILLKKQGYEPVGVSLKLPVWKSNQNQLCENLCCTKESLDIAKAVCKKFGIKHYIYDVQSDFKKEVINYFVSELKNKRTPNPCAVCNRFHKFAKLLEFAKNKNIKLVATGHYAKIKINSIGEPQLLIPKDKTKDQTYGLSFLTKDQLKQTIFPLADLLKTEVFEIAKKEGFKIFEKKKESQNFCFVSNKSLPLFIKKEIGIKKGKIIDTKGNILGEHNGVHFYTIGQRKGLGLSKKYFVLEKKDNILIVTTNEKELYKNKFTITNFNLLVKELSLKKKYLVKTRYSQKACKAKIIKKHKTEKTLEILLLEPQKAITPGQVCTIYDKEICVGGGFIK